MADKWPPAALTISAFVFHDCTSLGAERKSQIVVPEAEMVFARIFKAKTLSMFNAEKDVFSLLQFTTGLCWLAVQ